MFGSSQPETPFPPTGLNTAVGPALPAAPSAGTDNLLTQELDAALQLLVERAQYITGATGAALALTQDEAMVCRASAGKSGPAVGAHLQVRSGLSGESIVRKQLLRCDNAETDPRVNIETCRQLGIASIVVLPLVTRDGEVRGIFELFSDHPYAFEERDLIALERMADLTLTALDLAERKPRVVAAPDNARAAPQTEPQDGEPAAIPATPIPASLADTAPQAALVQNLSSPVPSADPPLGIGQLAAQATPELIPDPQSAVVPEAMRRVQKCASCGFPISEGRTLCVDCENKSHSQPASAEAHAPQFVPAFLDSSPPVSESWLANHVNLLAVMVLILSILVWVVVFR
jgi:putative methionine-R-sulfoxide reductase with GAF domain